MAALSSQSADIEMQRAELSAVLASQEFVRAPKLAHLLSYLCEKLFAGEAGQIKEYSIGVEVFQRGASFDQDSDSIVRVEANRLRKRLAEYYAGEGASHTIHITIPLGQYVPRFEARATRGSIANGSESAATKKAPESAGAEEWLRRKWWVVAIGIVLLCAIGIGYGVYWRRSQQKTAPEAVARQAQPESADVQVGPPVGEEIRILAGATRSLVDHAGKLWSADVAYTGGTATKSSVQHVGRTLDSGFYRTSRQGEFRYDIPLKRGVYELRLVFAETLYGPDATGTGGEGSRLMTVRANGQALLSHFDVIADAGASRVADMKVFAGISPAADGKLHLEFTGEDGKQALLSAIEIVPGIKGGRIRPVRIVARQSPYYSNDSHWWSPDNYFEGGQLASYALEVTGTDDPELYETERWGNFSYAIPVIAGRYSLVLHFAARRNNPGEPAPETGAAPHVSHVFNVFCNGKSLLENFDLGKEAGQTDVVVRRFAGVEPNAQGKLLLSFVPVAGYATVSGIEVLPE